MGSKVSVIGLFSGAGGLELGAAATGADVRLSIDNDKLACESFYSEPLRMAVPAIT